MNIYDPESELGVLSNNYGFAMKIDDVFYSSVSNYIYSNMVGEGVYKNILRTYPAMGQKQETIDKVILFRNSVSPLLEHDKKHIEEMNGPLDQVYRLIKKKEYFDTINSALNDVITAKQSDQKFCELLLSTGNADLQYISNNDVMGIKDGLGYNLWGKKLVGLRRILTNKKVIKEEEVFNEKIYTIYKVYMFLTNKIFIEGDDLNEYMGNTYRAIYDSTTANEINIYPELIRDMFRTKRLDQAIYKTIADEEFDMASNLRKRFVDFDKKKKLKIFNEFSAKVLGVDVNNLDPPQEMIDRVFRLYSTGKIEGMEKEEGDDEKEDERNEVSSSKEQSSSSSKDQSSVMSENNIFKYFREDGGENGEDGEKEEGEEPQQVIQFNPETKNVYGLFSPLYEKNMNIKGVNYSSISLYIIMVLLGNLIGYTDAFKIKSSLNNDLNSLNQVYMKKVDELHEIQYSKLLKRGIEEKFKNNFFAHLLAMSGDVELVYDPPENTVGKMLMNIRAQLKKHAYIIRDRNLDDYIMKDTFVKGWFASFIKSTCNSIITVWNFVNSESSLVKQPVYNIISNIYNVNVNESEKVSPELSLFIKEKSCFSSHPPMLPPSVDKLTEELRIINEGYMQEGVEGKEGKDNIPNLPEYVRKAQALKEKYLKFSKEDLKNIKEKEKEVDEKLKSKIKGNGVIDKLLRQSRKELAMNKFIGKLNGEGDRKKNILIYRKKMIELNKEYMPKPKLVKITDQKKAEKIAELTNNLNEAKQAHKRNVKLYNELIEISPAIFLNIFSTFIKPGYDMRETILKNSINVKSLDDETMYSENPIISSIVSALLTVMIRFNAYYQVQDDKNIVDFINIAYAVLANKKYVRKVRAVKKDEAEEIDIGEVNFEVGNAEFIFEDDEEQGDAVGVEEVFDEAFDDPDLQDAPEDVREEEEREAGGDDRFRFSINNERNNERKSGTWKWNKKKSVARPELADIPSDELSKYFDITSQKSKGLSIENDEVELTNENIHILAIASTINGIQTQQVIFEENVKLAIILQSKAEAIYSSLKKSSNEIVWRINYFNNKVN
jgi:predicted NAD-dependent protein-ADP-ribosyltransferase YbiA (DUF1768 family)